MNINKTIYLDAISVNANNYMQITKIKASMNMEVLCFDLTITGKLARGEYKTFCGQTFA